MSDPVPLGRLSYRPLQLNLLAHWRSSQGGLADWIPLDHPFLDPFLKPSNVLQGRPIQAPPPQLTIYTDASTSGWGNPKSAPGLWSVPLRQQLRNGLPTESGEHSLGAHVSSNMANPSGVPAAGAQPVSEAHPRSSQCSSRQPFKKASNHRHRMVSAPQHSKPDVLHLVHS